MKSKAIIAITLSMAILLTGGAVAAKDDSRKEFTKGHPTKQNEFKQDNKAFQKDNQEVKQDKKYLKQEMSQIRQQAKEKNQIIKENHKTVKQLEKLLKDKIAKVKNRLKDLKHNPEGLTQAKVTKFKERLSLLKDDQKELHQTLGSIAKETKKLRLHKANRDAEATLTNLDNIISVQHQRIAALEKIRTDLDELLAILE